MENVSLTFEEFTRFVSKFYESKKLSTDIDRISLDAELVNYFNNNLKFFKNQKKQKVAFVFICLNPLYWQYAPEMVEGATKFFLPGHNTDFLFWTDIPENIYEINGKISQVFAERGQNLGDLNIVNNIATITNNVANLRAKTNIKIIPTESVDWPYPTLLRYNLFLQQEELLKEYDSIFYCDIDMRFMGIVGDEILSEGITAAQHPMYAVRKEYYPPYEPNPESASYIKRPGKLVEENGKKRFMPLYYAGGFQGGKADKFIEAMKECKLLIEKDMNRNYIPVWNDETAWNKYLSENPPEIVLSPSYIYPDSLIKEYYEPLWGCAYEPKLMTLTKWFSVSKEGGDAVAKMIQK